MCSNPPCINIDVSIVRYIGDGLGASRSPGTPRTGPTMSCPWVISAGTTLYPSVDLGVGIWYRYAATLIAINVEFSIGVVRRCDLYAPIRKKNITPPIGEWGVGSGEWKISIFPHSPLPTPHSAQRVPHFNFVLKTSK